METTKIQFKGYQLSRTKVKNNIIKVYIQSQASEKLDWYQQANDFCHYLSDKHQVPLDKVIGIVSALSPRKEWSLNKRIAEELILTGDCGQMKVFVTKANDIHKSTGNESDILSILNGPKIKSFYMNIKYPGAYDNVTIDRHAIAVALGHTATDTELSLSEKQYKFFKDCYVYTADKLGIKPLLLQSITWETWKRIK
jgi:hypothetical protein